MPDLFVAEKPQGPVTSSEKTKVTSSDRGTPSLPVISAGSPHEKKGHIGPLTSFSLFPERVSFENQETHEHVYLFLRRHFITNATWIFTTVLLVIAPVLLPVIVQFGGIPEGFIPGNYLLILLLFYYLIVFGYAFVNFISWFYNVGIVTQLRVIDIDIVNITNKNVASTGIQDIVDVEYTQRGFLSSILDFGDVNMQTEGLKANFEFHSIPHPARVSDIIIDLMNHKKDE